MKAVVYHGPGQKAWEDVETPGIRDDTDVIVRVDAVTICGTDLHILKGDVPAVTDGRILGHSHIGSATFERWGDPDETGTWGPHPFGLDVTGDATFDGVTIPSAGRVGWFHGTNRWADGEFFRFEITEPRLVSPSG